MEDLSLRGGPLDPDQEMARGRTRNRTAQHLPRLPPFRTPDDTKGVKRLERCYIERPSNTSRTRFEQDSNNSIPLQVRRGLVRALHPPGADGAAPGREKPRPPLDSAEQSHPRHPLAGVGGGFAPPARRSSAPIPPESGRCAAALLCCCGAGAFLRGFGLCHSVQRPLASRVVA